MRCRPVKHSMGYLQKSFSLVPYMGVMRQRPHILGNGAAPPQRSRTETHSRISHPAGMPQRPVHPPVAPAHSRSTGRYTTPASQINDGSGSWYLGTARTDRGKNENSCLEYARMLRPAPISHGKTLRAHRHKNVPSCIPSISFHLPYVRVDGHKRIQAIVSALEQCPRRQMHFPL